jgi:DNA-binding NarL/FixJ family response regulator
LAEFPIRVLVAEDHERFRRLLVSTLQKQTGVQVQYIRELADGLEAVQEAQSLQPDLILLDIGLPTLNGMEAARQIRKLSPASKIILVTQESSADIVQEALNIGACGYVVKTEVGKELLPALTAVLRGERFLGRSFAGHDFMEAKNLRTGYSASHSAVPASSIPPIAEIAYHRHEVQFYSDDESFLDGFTQFIGTGLKDGSAIIVIATRSHRESLLPRLQERGIDMTAAIDQRRYNPFDCVDVLSRFMVDDLPDPTSLFKVAGDLIGAASSGTGGASSRVVACGELAPLLLMEGKPESAIRLEQLWDRLVKSHGLDTLCGYPLSSFHNEQSRNVFQCICEEHSVVHSR